MITFYEGIVIDSPGSAEDSKTSQGENLTEEERLNNLTPTISVRLTDQPYVVQNVQLHVTQDQRRPPTNSVVLFYQQSDHTAKLVCILSDPTPIGSPIDRTKFNPGEIALSSLGNVGSILPQDGSLLWLKNSGDILLASGTLSQQIQVNDSTDSIIVQGKNIKLQALGNSVFTHAISIETSVVGSTEIFIGTRNPIADLPITGIHVKPLGGVNIGLEAVVPGIPVSLLLNGIGWDPILGVSAITTKFSVTAPLISLLGLTAIIGNTTIAGFIQVGGAATIVGNISIGGVVEIGGAVTMAGALEVKGVSSFTGILNIAGGLSFFPTIVTTGVGIPVPIGYIPVLINELPFRLAYYAPL